MNKIFSSPLKYGTQGFAPAAALRADENQPEIIKEALIKAGFRSL